MRKILSVFACTLCLATIANADLAKFEIGAGVWTQKPSGGVTYSDNGVYGNDASLEKEVTSGYVWALLKHPIPIIPNVRLEYANIESEGVATGTFKNFTANGGATSFKMVQYDVIPYYNILDNTFWITLDLGIDIKFMDLKYTANDVTVTNPALYNDNASLALPLLYARTRVEIPSTNVGIEADVKYVSYNSNTVYDARLKVDYTLDFVPVIQPAIEVGYRVQHIETDQAQDAQINLDFKGVYAGIVLRF